MPHADRPPDGHPASHAPTVHGAVAPARTLLRGRRGSQIADLLIAT